MSVTVKYFASLREHVGQAEQQCQVPEGGCSASEVWMQLNASRELPSNILVAVNQDYASLDTRINDGDEIAFFPPVTGG